MRQGRLGFITQLSAQLFALQRAVERVEAI